MSHADDLISVSHKQSSAMRFQGFDRKYRLDWSIPR